MYNAEKETSSIKTVKKQQQKIFFFGIKLLKIVII